MCWECKQQGTGGDGLEDWELASIHTEISEQADLRSWLTLPRNLQVLEVTLPAGSHDLTLAVKGQGGGTLNTLRLEGLEVIEGRRTFVSARSVGPNIFANLGTRGAER